MKFKQKTYACWTHFLRGIIAVACCFATAHTVLGATLGWDANTESNLAGYRLYYGTASGNYSQSVDVGKTTQATISNLSGGTTYYAAVTAYNTASQESAKSAEVNFVAASSTTGTTTTTPPSVSITSPTTGATYTAPATINLTANATQSNGTISSVEFWNGTTRIVAVNTVPYTFAWTNVAAGTYTLTAKAYNNAGASTTSASVTITVSAASSSSPTVSLSTASSTYTAPATVSFTATASETGGTISKVEFYNGTTLVATDTTAPYNVTFTGVAAGTYSVTAKAYDSKGLTATSAPITVTVGSVPTTSRPTVSITSPANATTYKAPATVTLTAASSETGGTISKVEFYNGSSLLATDTTNPYSVTFTGVPAGTYVITAKAYDSKGVTTTSSPVTVTVSP